MISGKGNPHAALRPPFDKGGTLEGELSFGLRDAVQVPTLIRLAFGQPPSPLKGEGFRTAARAAPTAYPEARLSFRRGRSQTGPRAHTVRPDREEKEARRE